MSILILLGIGAAFGVAGVVNQCKSAKPPASTTDERTRQVFAYNDKRMAGIMRKYR